MARLKGKRGGASAGGKKSEYDSRVLDLRRVARVMAGGKRFKFRATVVIGNHQGKVGVGVAKGADVSKAVEKATSVARKDMISVPLVKGTIPHEVSAKYSAARVMLKPASEGRGLVAGGAVRAICSLAGVRSISSKVLGRTSNKLNNARATMEALKQLKARVVAVAAPSVEKKVTEEKANENANQPTSSNK